MFHAYLKHHKSTSNYCNPNIVDIYGALLTYLAPIFALMLIILILNSEYCMNFQYEEGARDVNDIQVTMVKESKCNIKLVLLAVHYNEQISL